ncbi:MAG: carboxypeptidase-like regulatory domain-containing protein [Acidobacteriota bacterium]
MGFVRSTKALLLCGGAAGLIATMLVLPTQGQQNTKQQAKQAKQTKQTKSKYVSPAGFITGTVQGERGPEAGVWVIAETKDLPTNFIKIVVTNDQGQFALPELPAGNYKVWVRGYGINDSAPVDSKPGATGLTLRATTAKTPQDAAKVYPGDYWFSLLEPPAASIFPGTGTGPTGNGIPRADD